MARQHILAFRNWVFELKQMSIVLDDLPREYSISDGKSHIGWIIPFSFHELRDYSKINMLVSWRNDHRDSFLSNEKVTFDSTNRWLDKQVLSNINRELFWIVDSDKEYIGHAGIMYDEVNQRFEIDSILKGVHSKDGIMWLGIRFLEKVVHEKFQASQIFLRVLETNIKAINFYHRNGYEELATAESPPTISELKRVILMVKDIAPKSLIE